MNADGNVLGAARNAREARRRERDRRPRVAYLISGLGFLVVAVVLALGLGRDPRLVPSPLIGKPVPEFELPPVRGRTLGLSSENLRGEVSLVNVFASWCVACREEHPLLMALAREGIVAVHGLNYKDRPEDAAAWLAALGDPYTRTGADIDGRVGIDWGVYGVPETFLVDADGRIAFKHIGPIPPAMMSAVAALVLLGRLIREDSVIAPDSGAQRV